MTNSLAPLLRRLRRLAAPPAPQSDAALLSRFAHSRDEAAFAELVARHGPMVLRVCRRALGDAHAAEDAFQAAFLVLARKAGAIRRPAALSGWLYGVAQRVARKARGALFRRRLRQAAAHDREPADPSPSPPAELTAREQLAAVDEEVGRLPEAYRLPVLLCCLEGLTQEEAARRLGWSPGSVRGRLERGRRRLHARLLRRGLTLAAALAAAEATRAVAAAPALAGAAVKAAAALAAGRGAAGASPGAMALAGEAAATGGTKLKVGAALALAAGLAVAGAGLAAVFSPQASPPAAKPAAPAPPLRLRRPDGPAAAMRGDVSCWGLAFSPDGTRLAGGGHDKVVRAWDAASGKRLLSTEANAGIVFAVCFSHDGALLASAADKVRLWDARTGEAVRVMEGKAAVAAVPYTSVAFSPDDTLLAGTAAGPADERLLQAPADGKRYGVLTLWDPSTGKAVRTLEGSGGGPVAFSPDGKRLAGGAGGGKVAVWDASTGKAVLRPGGGYANAVAFSPDGKRLAAGDDDGALRVWDAAEGEEVLAVAHAHARRVVGVSFTPDGKYLVTAGQRRHEQGLFSFEPWPPDDDGEVKVWDAASGEALFAFKTHVSGVSGTALSPDGTRVAASTLAGGQPVRIWSLASD